MFKYKPSIVEKFLNLNPDDFKIENLTNCTCEQIEDRTKYLNHLFNNHIKPNPLLSTILRENNINTKSKVGKVYEKKYSMMDPFCTDLKFKVCIYNFLSSSCKIVGDPQYNGKYNEFLIDSIARLSCNKIKSIYNKLKTITADNDLIKIFELSTIHDIDVIVYIFYKDQYKVDSTCFEYMYKGELENYLNYFKKKIDIYNSKEIKNGGARRKKSRSRSRSKSNRKKGSRNK
jgi:hypothetical protein